jgi:hypothetical protein
MTKIYKEQTFRSFYDRNSGKTYSDLEFHRCHFISLCISITRKPQRRSTVRNVKFYNFDVRGCALDSAIVEDVLVDGLKTNGIFKTWGAVFKHVVLKGRIEGVMISPAIRSGVAKPKEQRAFDEANAAYYEGVDWALDIRDSIFQVVCDIRDVPARLVKRDPETQVVIKREKALEGTWQKLDHLGVWETAIELFLNRGDTDVVLVAPKGDREFRGLINGLNSLCEAGIAEPD